MTNIMKTIIIIIIRALFRTHPVRGGTDFGNVGYFLNLTPEDLGLAVRTVKDGKAPGPDGILSAVLKAPLASGFRQKPGLLLKVYNASLTSGMF